MTTETTDKPVLTARDIAEYLNIGLTKANGLMHAMPHLKIGRVLRVKREDFIAWLEQIKEV